MRQADEFRKLLFRHLKRSCFQRSKSGGKANYLESIGRVEQLGYAIELAFERTAQGLVVLLPIQKPNELAYAFCVMLA